jgi:hypothetical protein
LTSDVALHLLLLLLLLLLEIAAGMAGCACLA